MRCSAQIISLISFPVGGRNYFVADHKDWGVAGLNDFHKEEKDVLGISPFAAVLNGIEFRTNTQSYKLKQPSMDGSYDGMKGLYL